MIDESRHEDKKVLSRHEDKKVLALIVIVIQLTYYLLILNSLYSTRVQHNEMVKKLSHVSSSYSMFLQIGFCFK